MAGKVAFNQEAILAVVEPIIYGKRVLMLVLLGVLTALFAWFAAGTHVDAGFDKSIPLEHPYMKVLKQYEDDFGGANTVLVALIQKDKSHDIYNEHFLTKLKQVTDEIFFLPGIDRSRVSSLFTPDVRFVEVVEGGFAGGNVIPAEYQPNEYYFNLVRGNVGKGGHVGRYVSKDQRGAMVFSELLEVDPVTGKKLDYREVARQLEQKIRGQYQDDQIDIHIVGFAKVIGDVTDAANEVVMYFFVALGMTFILLILYLGSFKLSILPLVCSFIAVIWEFGLLTASGFGLDPFAILVPFLILAVSVSHGVQYTSSWVSELATGKNGYDASLETFRRLAIPGTTALITDLAGFLTILLIPIDIIREMAINASFGMAAIIVTNKILMPIWLTYMNVKDVETFVQKQEARESVLLPLFRAMTVVTRPVPAAIVIIVSAVAFGFSLWMSKGMLYGDSQAGVPELRPDSRYNNDSNAITANFTIGTDIIKVIAETDPEACIKFDVMEQIDRFGWHMENDEGVASILSLPWAARTVNSAFSEAAPKFKVLPRNQYVMVQAITPIPTSSGLLNPNCAAMAVFLFTKDHKAETLARLTDEVKAFNAANAKQWFELNPGVDAAYCDRKNAARSTWLDAKVALKKQITQLKARNFSDADVDAHARVIELRKRVDESKLALDGYDKACPVNFALASAQGGVMAASNEVVKAKDKPILYYVYAVIIVFLWLSFRNVAGVFSILAPLYLVSEMIVALMAMTGIGMKVATLPVAALAVGIGVDYGIYIYSTIEEFVKKGKSLADAYYETLRMTGKPVMFTGLVLSGSVATWLMSGLQFQADMGLLLTFAFFANMIGAIVGCPAICRYLMKLPNG
ncbi:MMPL family transporter [Fontimonas sp. SYSU GA230001]|uniref:efflux RND transporter permease subunit n=1 Tax=Fontimonas sp. SYSU GA230001 TaxID=3142450 RepID=UPI0032B33F04